MLALLDLNSIFPPQRIALIPHTRWPLNKYLNVWAELKGSYVVARSSRLCWVKTEVFSVYVQFLGSACEPEDILMLSPFRKGQKFPWLWAFSQRWARIDPLQFSPSFYFLFFIFFPTLKAYSLLRGSLFSVSWKCQAPQRAWGWICLSQMSLPLMQWVTPPAFLNDISWAVIKVLTPDSPRTVENWLPA